MNEMDTKVNEMDTKVNEMDTSKPVRSKLRDRLAYTGTPGAAYVDDFLPGLGMEDDWIAETINDGALLICPRCLFLHLPTFPLLLLLGSSDPPPVDACDVCAHAYGAAGLWFEVKADMMEVARTGLGEARTARARLFYELWMGASDAADTWVLAAMGQTLLDIKEASRQTGKEAAKAG